MPDLLWALCGVLRGGGCRSRVDIMNEPQGRLFDAVRSG